LLAYLFGDSQSGARQYGKNALPRAYTIGNLMSRKPSPKPTPGPGLHVITVNKKSAATGQLETAILLWFREGDPISIHALAAAAHDCFHAMGKNTGKPAVIQTWLESQSQDLQERSRYIQNFIKHGFKDLHGEADYCPAHGEILMFDAVTCYQGLFEKKTPLMTLFYLRYLFENPDHVHPESKPILFEKGAIYDLLSASRRRFLEEALPLVKGSG
jgi:hypothetical protein